MQTDLTATSILSLMDTTKDQRRTFVEDVVRRIDAGEANPLTVHAQVKSMENIIETLTDHPLYRQHLLYEAEKHGKKFEFHNSEFQVKEAGVKYDYSKCGSLALADAIEMLERQKLFVKEFQDQFKAIPTAGLEVINQATGEVEHWYPPTKTSTTVVSVKLS
jgi:hypothetical protein